MSGDFGIKTRGSKFPPAIYFSAINCARHGDLGEVVIQQYSHRMISDVIQQSSSMSGNDQQSSLEAGGVVFGVFASPLDVHKKFAYDLVEVLTSQ